VEASELADAVGALRAEISTVLALHDGISPSESMMSGGSDFAGSRSAL